MFRWFHFFSPKTTLTLTIRYIHPFLHALTSLLPHLGLCNYSDWLITTSSSSSSLFSLYFIWAYVTIRIGSLLCHRHRHQHRHHHRYFRFTSSGPCNSSDRLIITSSSSTSSSSASFSLYFIWVARGENSFELILLVIRIHTQEPNIKKTSS